MRILNTFSGAYYSGICHHGSVTIIVYRSTAETVVSIWRILVAEHQVNGGVTMIARMWHGRVPTSKTQAYRDFLNQRAIGDYQAVPGNLAVYILEREEGAVTHFVTLTFWESLEAIRGFAGDELERAKYYPEDKEFLLEFEPTVLHYEVAGRSSLTP
jgi:heme-degrading monooxygenase HmoA